MFRNYTVFFAASAILILAGRTRAQEVDLSKVPVFKVGDKITVKTIGQSSKNVQTSEGKTTLDVEEKSESSSIYEVLSVDGSGKITELRKTVLNNKINMVSKAPEIGQKEVIIEDVVGTLNRSGSSFVVDRSSLASSKMKDLTASKIAVIKDSFVKNTSIPGYSETDAILLPSKPIVVGGTWEIDKEKLEKWVENSRIEESFNCKARSAKFKLLSLTDNIAEISGIIAATLTISGNDIDVEFQVGCKINADTGLWQSEDIKMSFDCEINKRHFKGSDNSTTVTEYKPGSGKTSDLMPGLTNLGWTEPGKDENSFKSEVMGVSLDITKDYETIESDPKTGQIKFTSNKKMNIAMDVNSVPILMDLEEFGPMILKGFKTINGYEIKSKDPVTLAGNVPGELIVATIQKNTVYLMTLYVIDGKRIISISAVAPVDDTNAVAEIKKILKSLRIFKPVRSRAN